MHEELSTTLVGHIMDEFARSTGLEPPGEYPRRYLWTDAFAVCNFLELWRRTGEDKYKELALRLVDQVHHILGKHREDDSRKGWISGLDEAEGRRHPTAGGLRIGKGMSERKPGEPFDEQLEWEQDGQYFHYLTKWMHALNRVSTATGDFTYNRWAMELAKAAYSAFIYTTPHGGQKRMYWKMSIDMSYPLVPSMGHHDPLDGFITFSQLNATDVRDRTRSTGLDLTAEIVSMASICAGKNWITDDTLGLGGLLSDAYRVGQLILRRDFNQTDLLPVLLEASLAGLKSLATQKTFHYPADYRLAFRELGLSIGLHAVERLRKLFDEHKGLLHEIKGLGVKINDLIRYVPMGETIETFWLDDTHRRSDTWKEHRDINMVMLATSLASDAYLII